MEGAGRESHEVLSPAAYPELREAQRSVIAAWSAATSFVCGPPETGKTTTLAAVAECLISRPNCRMLVVAPSNNAVDHLVIAVDKVLERRAASRKIRERCIRIGSRANAAEYRGRRFLLLDFDPELDPRITDVLAAEPQADTAEWNKWKSLLESLRGEGAPPQRTVSKRPSPRDDCNPRELLPAR
jgi:hypothetical protein